MGDAHLTRRLAFTVAAGPLLAWIPVTIWLHAHLDEWIASRATLPFAVFQTVGGKAPKAMLALTPGSSGAITLPPLAQVKPSVDVA